MKRRSYGTFMGLLCLFLAACVSIWGASGSAEYVAAAAGQSLYRLDVAKSRGTLYDCKGRPLTGAQRVWVAAVAPTPEALGTVDQATGGRYRERLAAALADGKPFAVELDQWVDSPYLEVISVPRRYSEDQLAAHVVGYLDSLGGGASGVELGMDDVLSACAGEAAVYYRMDALGHAVAGAERRVENWLERSRAGVQLTLDRDIQALAERAGQALGKGAVVVSQAPDCALRAVASFPGFSPLHLDEAQENEDGALLNRAFLAYAPGSVFKLVPAAALLETDPAQAAERFPCTGSVGAGGMLFACAGGEAHGAVDLQGALEQSCNGYFISAARSLGGQTVLNMAYNLGLGSEVEFCRGLSSEAGVLPEAASLENPRALANFGFGQGETTVTPVQVCGLLNAVVSDGVYTTPRLIEGLVDRSRQVQPVRAVTEQSTRAMSPATARRLQEILCSAAQNGTGKPGAPAGVTVGIKTGTAQTGVFDPEGERMHRWYTGFVCGEEGPVYCITVLREGVVQDDGITAQVFRTVAEELGRMLGEQGSAGEKEKSK